MDEKMAAWMQYAQPGEGDLFRSMEVVYKRK